MRKRPEFVAKKSMVSALNIWLILFSLLVIPFIIQVWKILLAKSYRMIFYKDRVVVKYGIINRVERQSIFVGVYAVNVDQSFWGDIFNYGTVLIDCPGQWNVHARGIKYPRQLKKYLENKFVTTGMTHIIAN